MDTAERKDCYFAGIIEGRGWLGSESRGAKGSRRAGIKIYFGDHGIARIALEHFGLGSVTESPSNHKGKSQWLYEVRGRAALEVMERLNPCFMGPTGDIATVLLHNRKLWEEGAAKNKTERGRMTDTPPEPRIEREAARYRGRREAVPGYIRGNLAEYRCQMRELRQAEGEDRG